MEQVDLFADELASELRQRAGVRPDEVVDSCEFAVRLVGPKAIVVLDRLAVGARLVRQPDGTFCIQVRDGLDDINFAIAHEVGHWGLRELRGYRGDDEELLANRVGAALLMPRPVVDAVTKRYGTGTRAARPLARIAEVSTTAAELRLQEVTGIEGAVITRTGNVIVRNPQRIDWSNREIRQLRFRWSTHPKLAKTALSGISIDEDRVAVRVRGR